MGVRSGVDRGGKDPCSPQPCPPAERQWFMSVQGLGTCIQTGRTESFCAWTLLPDSPSMLVRSARLFVELRWVAAWVPRVSRRALSVMVVPAASWQLPA